MSASERLRALIAEGWEMEAVIVLRDALPLIADVVEAAEALNAVRYGEIEQRLFYRQREALTALREHLEGGDE